MVPWKPGSTSEWIMGHRCAVSGMTAGYLAEYHGFPGALVWIAGTALLSLLLVGASLRYARWRGLLDAPGRRRSHSQMTPRGGGLGLILAAAPALTWSWLRLAPGIGGVQAGLLLLALLALLLTGWLDDHRDLPNLPRLLAHVVASAILAWVIVHGSDWPAVWKVLVGAGLLLAAVWSINAHNFMDGIDALLGMQMLFVFTALALIAVWYALPGVALACAAIAAACAGFLCYNRPPARIFMGDVGSVPLGWLVVAMAAVLWRHAPQTLWAALILCSAFVIDASITLLRRMWLGRRWYTAHREHVYQWLVRSGFGHGRVVMFYLAWNLLLALPMAVWALLQPQFGPVLLAIVLVAGVWLQARVRTFCLARRERRRSGVA